MTYAELYQKAHAAFTTDPAAAIEHLNAALELVSLDSPDAKAIVLLLADALTAAGMKDDVKELWEACKDRWPDFTELAAKAAIKPRRPLTVVACIPGREFSGRFFDAWNEFSAKCHAVGINLVISRRYDAVVYYARNRVAGGDVRRGPKQVPWGGDVDYDFMLWIDSDVVFTFEDFQALLAHKVEMVAGLYLMADNVRYSAVEHMNEETFRQHGEFDFLTPQRLAKKTSIMPVDYCGFGFVLVRKGVFERMEYPWFRPVYLEMGECTEFTSEDVGFCMMAKRAGIQMMIDPTVVVGHEKHVVLAPPRAA